jgi:hypothetical protein
MKKEKKKEKFNFIFVLFGLTYQQFHRWKNWSRGNHKDFQNRWYESSSFERNIVHLRCNSHSYLGAGRNQLLVNAAAPFISDCIYITKCQITSSERKRRRKRWNDSDQSNYSWVLSSIKAECDFLEPVIKNLKIILHEMSWIKIVH